MPLLYTVGKLTLGNALRLGWRPTVQGLEHLPATGGVILAANHLSAADDLFLGAVVPRRITFWAKAEYFTGTGFGGWLTRAVIGGIGAIPVERTGGRAVLSAFDAAIPALRAGALIAVHPEGTRSPDGRLYRGRTGVARLALAAGVPVVPLGVIDTDKAQPIGALLPRLVPVTLRFGKPIDFTDRASDYSGLRAITDEVMLEIQRLSGQEYVPRYAPQRDAK